MLQKLKATVISKVLRGFYHLSLEPGYKMHGLNKIRGLCIKLACTGFITSHHDYGGSPESPGSVPG